MTLNRKHNLLQDEQRLASICNRMGQLPLEAPAPNGFGVLAMDDNGDKVLQIEIYDVIGPSWAGMIDGKLVAAKLKEHANLDRIDVMINSVGGGVFEGIAIYNILVRHEARVLVHIDGAALSSASLVAMAGDEIRMAENALMMIHDPWLYAMGSAAELRADADILDKTKANIVKTYAARTGMTPAVLDKMMSDETWFEADEAVDSSFADVVVKAKAKPSNGAKDASNMVFKNAPQDLAERLSRFRGESDEHEDDAAVDVTDVAAGATPRLAHARARQVQSLHEG